MTLSDDDIERIVGAVETMEASLAVLADKQSLSREEYVTDRAVRDIVERRFVKLTEAALDVARTLVGHERETQPDSNPAVMVALGDVGVLDDATTEQMTQTARFRNVLAHTYGDAINNDDVYDALQDLDRYQDFLIAVREYLDDIDSLE
jgi:uncharacterized protein YutE (UPF0331/DUF86 family)